jgi:hypothetical protein
MSSSHQQTDLSISNFTNIFDAASNEYEKLTKHDLRTHPFAAALGDCDSPEAVLNIFRTQAQAFDKFCKGDDRLMKWLDPTVHILFTLSATLGEGIALVSVEYTFILYYCAAANSSQPFPPAKTIFTGIGVLLGVRPFQCSSINLGEMCISGGKGRYCKPWNACQPVRAHSIFH